MTIVPLTRANAKHFADRLLAVRPDSPRLWGTMEPAQMMAHLRRSIEISLAEVSVGDRSNWFSRSALAKWLVFGPIPYPRTSVKAPAYFFPTDGGPLNAERERTLVGIERFLKALEATPERTGPSELFGPMPLSYWAKIHGKHFDHHLKQFGC